jgi:hypothetical protein
LEIFTLMFVVVCGPSLMVQIKSLRYIHDVENICAVIQDLKGASGLSVMK